MQVEISNTGNANNELLHVYKLRQTGRGQATECKPMCSIYEDDFFELLTEKDFIKATEQNKIRFNVDEAELRQKAKTIFN